MESLDIGGGDCKLCYGCGCALEYLDGLLQMENGRIAVLNKLLDKN